MVKAARGLNRLPSEQALWAWLARIARNTYIDHIRGDRRLFRMLSFFQKDHQASSEVQMSEPDGLDQLLENALRSLEAEDLALVRAFYFEGKSQRELALESAVTPKSIERKLAKIRQDLHARLLRQLKDENR